MGCDPRATVYYGIRLKEKPAFDDMDANDAWANDNRPQKPADEDRKSPAWDAWRVKLREYEATQRHVEIDWSGAEDCESYYVHCPAMAKNVTWDEHLELSLFVLEPGLRLAELSIKEFCERFGLPYTQPRWHLCVRYF